MPREAVNRECRVSNGARLDTWSRAFDLMLIMLCRAIVVRVVDDDDGIGCG